MSGCRATTCLPSSRSIATLPAPLSTLLRLPLPDQHQLGTARHHLIRVDAPTVAPGATRFAQEVSPYGQRLVVEVGVHDLTDPIAAFGEYLESDDRLYLEPALILRARAKIHRAGRRHRRQDSRYLNGEQ